MTQTLTTDELRQIVETDHTQCGDASAMARELLANREAQPVAGELGEIRVGRLPTMNQEEYPGLGDWWVQLRIGENHDEILARVYGATPEEAVARARLLTAPPAPAVPGILTDSMAAKKAFQLGAVLNSAEAEQFAEGWNACRAAMLKHSGDVNNMAQPVSQGYKLVPVEPTRQMMAQGHFAMKGTDRGKFRRIYQAMVAAAPEVSSD